MKHIHRRHALLAIAAATAGHPLHAAAFPARPITLVVPFPAGGPTDRHLRTLAELAGPLLGQPVVVENRPGAGGTLGASGVALAAKPDGYTLSQLPPAMLRLPHMQKTAWHPLQDLSFIVGASRYTHGLVVRADLPLHNFEEFRAHASRSPIHFGSAGVGSTGHMMFEELALAAGFQAIHVPFKGSADMMQALVGGHISAVIDAAGWDKLVDAGRLRLLLAFAEKPFKRWPQVPTAQSLGFVSQLTSAYGIVGPAGMDPAVVGVLQAAFLRAMADPRHLAQLEELGQEPWFLDSSAFRAWAVQAFAREKVLVDRLGLALRAGS